MPLYVPAPSKRGSRCREDRKGRAWLSSPTGSSSHHRQIGDNHGVVSRFEALRSGTTPLVGRDARIVNTWPRVVTKFRARVLDPTPTDPPYPPIAEIKHDLRGRDLGCWCPLDMPCHADVLLELANQPD